MISRSGLIQSTEVVCNHCITYAPPLIMLCV